MTRAVPKKPRDGNIELLRCLLMFAVVLDHSAVFGPLIGSWQGEFLFLATGPAVSGFVAISGWFCIKFSWNKWLRLLALAIVFRGGVWLFDVGLYLLGQAPSIPSAGFGTDWFVGAYLGLMLFAPLLNAGLEALAQTPKKLLSTWVLVAVATALFCVANGCSFFSIFKIDDWGAHTLGLLIFGDVTARTARLLEWPNRLRRWVYGLTVVMVLLLAAYSAFHILWPTLPLGVLRGLRLFFIMGLGVMSLFIFQRFRVQGWLGATARFLGPSMFGVYLIHSTTYGQETFLIPEHWLMEVCPALPPMVIIVIGAICCFVVSVGVDLIRRGILACLRHLPGFRWI